MIDGEKCEPTLGDASPSQANDRLFASLYEKLHRAARYELQRNSLAALGPTTLLHETFLNVSQRQSVQFADWPSFMAYAARAMRGLIIDRARHAHRQKRGGAVELVSLSTELQSEGETDLQVERLREALEELAAIDPRLAECVDLKFFCGFSFRDIARVWSVSERTVQREWDKARVLLNRLMIGDSPASLQPP